MSPAPTLASAALALSTYSIPSPKTIVITGSTTGMGAATARLFSKLGCERIIIFGRNQARAEGVLKDIETFGEASGKVVKGEYVQGDLATVEGMKGAAKDIEGVVGPSGIDYLVMCQSGVPTGTIDLNVDGIEKGFAIQVVSRFALAYLLTSRGVLAPSASVLSVANVGNSLDDLQVDDLNLTKKLGAGRWKLPLLIDQSKRDSSVLDAFHLELNARFPQYNYYHVFPGLVKTEDFTLSTFPFPMNYLSWLGLKIMGITPEVFARTPAYILLNPNNDSSLSANKFWNFDFKPLSPGRWAQNAENREKVWAKLLETIGEKSS